MIATQNPAECPVCGLTATVTSTHHTSEGPVYYLRCVCGQIFIALAGEVIGAAGASEFDEGRVSILGSAEGSPAPFHGRASQEGTRCDSGTAPQR